MSKFGPKKKEITAKMIVEIEEMAGLGMTTEQIHLCLGMGHNTFYERCKENPEIQEAIKRGKPRAIRKVAATLFEKGMKGDTTSLIFYLKSQAGWKEARDDSKVNISFSKDEREELESVAELMRKKKLEHERL